MNNYINPLALEILIKYIKSILWRVAKRLSYIEDAQCLKVKAVSFHLSSLLFFNDGS